MTFDPAKVRATFEKDGKVPSDPAAARYVAYLIQAGQVEAPKPKAEGKKSKSGTGSK